MGHLGSDESNHIIIYLTAKTWHSLLCRAEAKLILDLLSEQQQSQLPSKIRLGVTTADEGILKCAVTLEDMRTKVPIPHPSVHCGSGIVDSLSLHDVRLFYFGIHCF